MYLLRRWAYYLRSLFTLVAGVQNWPRLFKLLSRQAGPQVLVLRNGAQFVVRSLMDAWTLKETNLNRDYERYGAAIQENWTVVDIGAALGDFTVFAASRATHGWVYAFEPAPDSVAILQRNLELNKIRNVTVFPNAVAATAGTLTLDLSGGVPVQYRTAGAQSGGLHHNVTQPAGLQLTVQSLALADVLADLPRGVCDFLKMDCEGAEYDILLNLDDVALGRVRRICLEYHEGVTEYSHADLEGHFIAHGWRVRVYPSRVRPELGFLYAESPAAPSGLSPR